jgi:glycosyl hydrolase family 20
MKKIIRLSVLKITFLCVFLGIFGSQYAQDISIIPQPKEMKVLSKGPFKINTETIILINSGATESDLSNADELNSKIYKIAGYHLSVSSEPLKELNNLIVIGEPDKNSILKNALVRNNIEFTSETPGDQGYVIYSNAEVLLLAGNDPAGTFYALQSLLSIINSNRGYALNIPGLSIRDYPSIKYRGLFNEDKWGPDRMTLEEYKDMIDYMGSIKMNTLSLGIYGCWGVQYRSEILEFFMLPIDKYPQFNTPKLIEYYSPKKGEWNELNYLPTIFKEDFFGDLIKYGKEKHVIVYPCFNSLGHNTLIPRLMPEISSVDENGQPRGYGFKTSNKKTYKVLFDIYDNIIDKYLKPNGIDWFDIQMDEVYQWDVNDVKNSSEEDIYLDHMIKISNYLKTKGMKHIGVWTDMLDHRKLMTSQFKERIESEGLKEVMRFQWWRYGSAYKTTNPELKLRSWVYPMTGYTYPYHFYYPISRLDNVYKMLSLGHKDKVEGASSYSIYDPAYHFENNALADFSWNPVDANQAKASEDFTKRYAKDVFGEKWKEAKFVLESMEKFYPNSQIFRHILYYRHSYVREMPYKKHPYPETAFKSLLKIPDAKEQLEKLGGIANNAANFYYTVLDCKNVKRDVIIQMYANIKRMSCLIEEFILLYDMEDDYQKFRKISDIDSKLSLLEEMKNKTDQIFSLQIKAIKTWEDIKPEFLHPHSMRNMSFMLKFCEENIQRIEEIEYKINSNSLKEIPETLIVGTYKEL